MHDFIETYIDSHSIDGSNLHLVKVSNSKNVERINYNKQFDQFERETGINGLRAIFDRVNNVFVRQAYGMCTFVVQEWNQSYNCFHKKFIFE